MRGIGSCRCGHYRLFAAQMAGGWIPATADGMLIHYHTRHTQEGLREFLVGNGAKQFEALLPYYRHVMARTVALSGWRWLLVMLLTAFALLFVSFFGGLQLSAAVWLTVVLWVSCLVCSLLTLLGSTFLYDRLNR